MTLIKMLWYFIKGIAKLIAFWGIMAFYPFFLLPAMILEIGGWKGAADKIHKKFGFVLDKITGII